MKLKWTNTNIKPEWMQRKSTHIIQQTHNSPNTTALQTFRSRNVCSKWWLQNAVTLWPRFKMYAPHCELCMRRDAFSRFHFILFSTSSSHPHFGSFFIFAFLVFHRWHLNESELNWNYFDCMCSWTKWALFGRKLGTGMKCTHQKYKKPIQYNKMWI